MTQETRSTPDFFPSAPMSLNAPSHSVASTSHTVSLLDEQAELLRDILSAQDRTNELLEELVGALGAAQKQRVTELNQWKEANPQLAESCRQAAEALSQVQVQFLNMMTDEINANSDGYLDGEFLLNEFVDRFGPRLVHLNGVIQVLSQLSNMPNPAGMIQ